MMPDGLLEEVERTGAKLRHAQFIVDDLDTLEESVNDLAKEVKALHNKVKAQVKHATRALNDTYALKAQTKLSAEDLPEPDQAETDQPAPEHIDSPDTSHHTF